VINFIGPEVRDNDVTSHEYSKEQLLELSFLCGIYFKYILFY
jgi:hypothetical protein